ncbi:SLATT domain-containing protein [Acinetobacter pittii]|uniref:SLATT domain-containing protein n=1 Tax=Acinetobacter pittii TaxID=48296 RepID=UPI0021CDB955|nr:SLATT domain-containing protein [Acinetobacter pittii]MCU4549840.1 SLATT domain-containing protein [Acinetobacter pittii]
MELKDKVWWTKKSKIFHEKRLLAYNFHSQLLLIWYSLFTVAASTLNANSLYLLGINQKQLDPNILIIFSVLTLTMSCFVSSLNFKGRSLSIKQCYENLALLNYENDNEANHKYQKLLDSCENHEDIDYINAKINIYYSTPKNSRIDIHPSPTVFEKIQYVYRKVVNFIILSILYILPIYTIYFTESNWQQQQQQQQQQHV